MPGFGGIGSGSITGLLVGGLPASQGNPVPTKLFGADLTGTLRPVTVVLEGATGNPTGTPVLIVGGVDDITSTIGSLPLIGNAQFVAVSGSVGLTVGGVNIGSANPLPVSSSFITASGSMIGLLQGGLPVSNQNAVPVEIPGVGVNFLNTGSLAVGVPLNPGPNWADQCAGADATGTLRVLLTDGYGRLITSTAAAAAVANGIAYGDVTTTATTNVPIIETTYTEQTASFGRSIVSTSANDAAAGTGARSVTITYYDNNFNGPYTETDTLNGTTAVNTTNTNICYIEKMVVASVGTGGVPAGTIELFQSHGGTGGVIWSIAAGENQTNGAHHYVPSGYTTYITGMNGNNNNGSNNTTFAVYGQASGSTAPLIRITDAQTAGGGGSPINQQYASPPPFSGPGRLILYGQPAGTPSIISRGSFTFYDVA